MGFTVDLLCRLGTGRVGKAKDFSPSVVYPGILYTRRHTSAAFPYPSHVLLRCLPVSFPPEDCEYPCITAQALILARYDALQNADPGGMTQRLVNNAIAFCKTKQSRDLLFACVGVQIEVQSNLLKTDGNVFGHAKRAAKIEIALGANACSMQRNAERGSDCAQRYACAPDQCLEQHVGRTSAFAIAAGRRMQPGFHTRFSRRDFASDIASDSSLGAQRDQCCFGALAILRF